MFVAKRMDKGVACRCRGWTAMQPGQHASEYAPLPALKGPDGKQYVISDPDHLNYGRNEILITNKCKDPANCSNGWINSTRMMPASKTSMDPWQTEKDGDKYEVLAPKRW